MVSEQLRPLERRILRQVAAGDDLDEIGRRLNRSPDFVRRVIDLTDVPREHPVARGDALRPVERRVLRLRAEGVDYDDMGYRFRRSPEHIERIEQFAQMKLTR